MFVREEDWSPIATVERETSYRLVLSKQLTDFQIWLVKHTVHKWENSLVDIRLTASTVMLWCWSHNVMMSTGSPEIAFLARLGQTSPYSVRTGITMSLLSTDNCSLCRNMKWSSMMLAWADSVTLSALLIFATLSSKTFLLSSCCCLNLSSCSSALVASSSDSMLAFLAWIVCTQSSQCG